MRKLDPRLADAEDQCVVSAGSFRKSGPPPLKMPRHSDPEMRRVAEDWSAWLRPSPPHWLGNPALCAHGIAYTHACDDCDLIARHEELQLECERENHAAQVARDGECQTRRLTQLADGSLGSCGLCGVP